MKTNISFSNYNNIQINDHIFLSFYLSLLLALLSLSLSLFLMSLALYLGLSASAGTGILISTSLAVERRLNCPLAYKQIARLGKDQSTLPQPKEEGKKAVKSANIHPSTKGRSAIKSKSIHCSYKREIWSQKLLEIQFKKMSKSTLKGTGKPLFNHRQ